MTKLIKCKTPPVCDVCERKVRETSSKPVLLECDDMLCRDCWFMWYDGCNTRREIKNAVLRKWKKRGGAANLNKIKGGVK